MSPPPYLSGFSLSDIHVIIYSFFSGSFGSGVAKGWFEAGKLLRLAADLDAGTMRVAVVETDGTCTGEKVQTLFILSGVISCFYRLDNCILFGSSAQYHSRCFSVSSSKWPRGSKAAVQLRAGPEAAAEVPACFEGGSRSMEQAGPVCLLKSAC
jgi:hypothetical protein